MSRRLTTISAATLGECWLQTSAAILGHGRDTTYDGLAIRELPLLALSGQVEEFRRFAAEPQR